MCLKGRFDRLQTKQHNDTPEEQKWRASACNPEKATRMLKFQYILLGIWSVLTIAWIGLVLYDDSNYNWMTIVVLAAGYVNVILGIVNNKRVAQGRKPL